MSNLQQVFQHVMQQQPENPVWFKKWGDILHNVGHVTGHQSSSAYYYEAGSKFFSASNFVQLSLMLLGKNGLLRKYFLGGSK